MEGTLKDLFDTLNDRLDYVILRNWDDLFKKNVYELGHSDIDILCDNRLSFIELTGAKRIHKEKNRDNYIVPTECGDIRFDIRWIGDGYYPALWERQMLSRRVINEDMVYVLQPADHFYSLTYHALLQKKELSEDYFLKLTRLHDELCDESCSVEKQTLFLELREYLTKNKYKAEIPSDPGVYINYELFSAVPHSKGFLRTISRGCFNCKKQYIRIKSHLSSKK